MKSENRRGNVFTFDQINDYISVLTSHKVMKAYLTFILLIFQMALQTNSLAQEAVTDEVIQKKLDDYLTSAHLAFKFNGTALVARKGEILLQKGYGYSNVTTKGSNKLDTKFPILSITKPFTAIAILKLQEQGKLSVQDKLTKYFPDYPNGDKIKIHHLLTHSSGIYNYTEPVGIEDSALINHPISRQRVLDVFVTAPIEFKPGKGYNYNNSGYFLLGLIIEKVTGKPYETVIRELIFDPLGMTNSGFDFLGVADSLKAKGYEFLDEEGAIPYKHYDSTFGYSAGSIYSTVGDMYKWGKAISGKQILSEDSWNLALTPKVSQYGYGWMIGDFFKHHYVRHSGGYPGYMSEFIYYPEEDVTIILLNNFGTYDQMIWPVGMGIACIAHNMPYDNWKVRKPIKVDRDILLRYAGEYVLQGDKRKFKIELQDDRIYEIIPGLPPLELFSENENVFYFWNFNSELTFVTNGKNEVLKIIVHEHGKDYELVRLR